MSVPSCDIFDRVKVNACTVLLNHPWSHVVILLRETKTSFVVYSPREHKSCIVQHKCMAVSSGNFYDYVVLPMHRVELVFISTSLIVIKVSVLNI